MLLSRLKSLVALKPGTNTSRRRAKGRGGLIARIAAAGDRTAFSWQVREPLYQHLADQNRNGVSIEDSLANFRPRLVRQKRVSSDKIVGDVERRMRDGSTFAKALSKWVPHDEASVIDSGEISGNLPKALELIIESTRRVNRVNAAIKAATRKPLIYAVAMYGTLFFIGKEVVPTLASSFSRDNVHGLAAGLFVAGDLANSLWALLPPILVFAIVKFVQYLMPRWTGSSRITAERYFPFSFYRDIQGYTWLMGFTALLGAGVADVQILQQQMKFASPWLKERLHALHWRMGNGMSLSLALKSKGLKGVPAFGFPNPDVIDNIASLDGFADFPERISRVAVRWATDLEESTLLRAERYGFWMEVATYALIGLLIMAVNALGSSFGSAAGM